MRIIIWSSLNLHKTSIIALDGLQVWSIPIRCECSITTAPWPRIPARILLFLCSLPSGTTGSQSGGRLGVNCELGVRKAFSQFTSTIQIPSCMGINEARRSAPAIDAKRTGEGETVFARPRCVRLVFQTSYTGRDEKYHRTLAFIKFIHVHFL